MAVRALTQEKVRLRLAGVPLALPCHGNRSERRMIRPVRTELVRDPVARISISGVHGGDELDDRLERLTAPRPLPGLALGALLVGAAVGATVAYLLKRD